MTDPLRPSASSASSAVKISASYPKQAAVFAQDIKVAHSIFALPWAIFSAVLAARLTPGGMRWGELGLVLVCMVSARTVAMTANRLLDARLDARNPRTARRALPSGRLSRGFMRAALGGAAAVFVIACGWFESGYGNPWPLRLAVPVLLFISAYPLFKRFSLICHYWLGACLAMAPVCAWVAIRSSLDGPPLWMAAAVLTWTAGFDIIYACQDYEVDVREGLHSAPSRLGVGAALWVSRLTHLLCVGALIGLGVTTPQLGGIYAVGVGVAVILLIVEQALVRPGDLSKANMAFFNINGIISLLIGTLGVIDVILHTR